MSPERFQQEMRKFDKFLRVRKSADGRRWLIERRCARESKCLVSPKDRRKIDTFIAARDGFTPVMSVPHDRLDHQVFLELRAADMWQYRGAGPYADALEAQEQRQEEDQTRQDSNEIQAGAKEMYDKLRFLNGGEAGGFHSKCGGYEP